MVKTEFTDQQTDQQIDIRGHREVKLPIMIVVEGEMGEERWTWSSGGGLRWGERRAEAVKIIFILFLF